MVGDNFLEPPDIKNVHDHKRPFASALAKYSLTVDRPLDNVVGLQSVSLAIVTD